MYVKKIIARKGKWAKAFTETHWLVCGARAIAK